MVVSLEVDIYSVKCEDEYGENTPTWKVDGSVDIGNVRTVPELGLSVLSIPWSLLSADSTQVMCRLRRGGWGRQRCRTTHITRTVGRPDENQDTYYY